MYINFNEVREHIKVNSLIKISHLKNNSVNSSSFKNIITIQKYNVNVM